jgi:hypothetical protein
MKNLRYIVLVFFIIGCKEKLSREDLIYELGNSITVYESNNFNFPETPSALLSFLEANNLKEIYLENFDAESLDDLIFLTENDSIIVKEGKDLLFSREKWEVCYELISDPAIYYNEYYYMSPEGYRLFLEDEKHQYFKTNLAKIKNQFSLCMVKEKIPGDDLHVGLIQYKNGNLINYCNDEELENCDTLKSRLDSLLKTVDGNGWLRFTYPKR